MPKQTRMAEKQRQALLLKEAAMLLSARHGREERISGIPVRVTELSNLTIWVTPWGPDRYGLDIWYAGAGGAKVMNLQWHGEGSDDLTITSFRRGEWEQELTDLLVPSLLSS